jgi:predicted DNA-binding transcriptional regulator AlpA
MYNITPDELTAIIEAAVSRALGQSRPTPDRNAEIIDREELCRRLNITEPTVIRLEKKGKIPRMEIGTAIRYDWNKVVAALQADKGGKRFV